GLPERPADSAHLGRARRAVMRARSIVLAGFFGLLAAGCSDFDPASKVYGVRILGAKADAPYARPGQEVHLDLLAVDGRADKPKPMQIAWIAAPCVDPEG